MLKVILDTNVFVPGVIWQGIPGEVLNAWIRGKVEVILSEDIIKEIVKTLKKLHVPEIKIDRFQNQLFANATMVAPQIRIDLVKQDPSDNKFLECAIEGQVDFIVSGDKHLLNLGEIHGIKIIPARKLLKHT